MPVLSLMAWTPEQDSSTWTQDRRTLLPCSARQTGHHCTALHWRQDPEIWNTPRRQGWIRPRSLGGRKRKSVIDICLCSAVGGGQVILADGGARGITEHNWFSKGLI